MNSPGSDWELPQPSFLIQKSPDQRLFASFPEHIAGYHVFRRLSMPRHPPYTLSSLTTFIDHRHKNCLVLSSSLSTANQPSTYPSRSLIFISKDRFRQIKQLPAGGPDGVAQTDATRSITDRSDELCGLAQHFAKKVLDD